MVCGAFAILFGLGCATPTGRGAPERRSRASVGDTDDGASLRAGLPETAIVRVRHHGQKLLSPRALELSESRGSGFLVSADGYVVTNHHVVASRGLDDEYITVEQGETLYFAQVVGFDAGGDLAVLRIRGAPRAMPYLTLRQSLPRPGESVRVIGHPGGGERTEIVGTVLRLALPDPTGVAKGYLESDAIVTKGSSGSPVLDARGDVIGIINERSPTRSRAVLAEYLRRRLAQWNVPLR